MGDPSREGHSTPHLGCVEGLLLGIHDKDIRRDDSYSFLLCLRVGVKDGRR